MPPLLIVLSHVRWSAAGSRPQHLMSRLAGRWRVVFVEEPRHHDGPATLQQHGLGEHLSVLVPHTPLQAQGFHDEQLAAVLPLLADHLAATVGPADVVWLTTPMALPLAHALQPRCVVYDCMEALTGLEGAPRQMAQRERALLQRADLVFAGGPSLYGERSSRHPAVHCLPNAVDAMHFAPAVAAAAGPAPQSAVGAHRDAPGGLAEGPRMGFHGPIDERVDLALLAAVADARPQWTLVMAGPVQGSEAPKLPQRSNVHWLGPQRYEDLPALIAGWDLAVMPFALTEPNHLASPLQTLEYLAADVPVVSTPLRDVAWLYSEAVCLAAPGVEGFVRACEETLAESPSERCRRAVAAMSVVAMHSWDHSADTVHALLGQTLQRLRPGEREPLRVVAAQRRA